MEERFSDDMNHNDTTNKLNQQSPVSFAGLSFHYFPLQRKRKTRTSGPVDGLPAKASTSATELKQQPPNLSIVFSFFKCPSSTMRQWKEIFPRCFISDVAQCNHTPAKDPFLPKSCHFLSAIKFQTRGLVGAEQLIFLRRYFLPRSV